MRSLSPQRAKLLFGSAPTEHTRARDRSRAGSRVERDSDPDKPVWLFVNLSQEFGGHEVMLLRWIDELQKSSQVAPVLVCQPQTRLAIQASGKCPVIETAEIARPGRKISRLISFVRLLALLRRAAKVLRPQIAVVAEGCILAQGHGLYAARMLRLRTVLYVPHVATFASMGFARAAVLEKRVRRFYGKLPDAWLTITADQAKELRRWSQVTQPIFTLPNTVASSVEEQSSMAVARIEAHRGDRRMRVLVMGRLTPYMKGLDLLLEYLRLTPSLAEQFSVRFVGEGEYAEVLAAALRDDARLAELVTLGPWADPIEALTQHDVLLLASRFEGVPLVMLEAMALGTPVVASDLEGTRPYLPEECLFPVGRIDKAFERLTALRESRAAWARIATRNLETFRQRASGAAFASAVSVLTADLDDLHRLKSRTPRSHYRPWVARRGAFRK